MISYFYHFFVAQVTNNTTFYTAYFNGGLLATKNHSTSGWTQEDILPRGGYIY
jgi:hypothetical protein